MFHANGSKRTLVHNILLPRYDPVVQLTSSTLAKPLAYDSTDSEMANFHYPTAWQRPLSHE